MFAKRRKRENKERILKHVVRKDISEGDQVHCLAFSYPLIDFTDGSNNEMSAADEVRYSDFQGMPATINAKRKWANLASIILDKNKVIPLKQMCMKSKHTDLIFDKM